MIPVQFRDRVVLMTGAAGGIGRALSFRIGGEGGRLALVDRNAAAVEKLCGDLKTAGIHCASSVADVRNREGMRQAVVALRDELGPVDILVAGAGLCAFAGVDDLMIPLAVEIMEVNFLGALYAIEAVLPEMLTRGSGQIVGIASLAAISPLPFEGAYCASKAALASYLASLRPALRKRGIQVTTVFPGFVRTPLLENLLAPSGAPMPPGVVEPGAAAAKIAAAIRRGSRESSFPLRTSWLAYFSRRLPPFVYDWIMTRAARSIPLRY
jgi:short-subunit dehydrogenase